MSNVTKLQVVRRDEMQPILSGQLPNSQRYSVYVSGEVTPRALRHIETMISLTRGFIEDDEAREAAENRDGDGI